MYGNWQIGDLIPSFKITADYSNLGEGKLTLHCLAEGNGKIIPIAQVSLGFNRPVQYKTESISLGTFDVQYKEGEQVLITRTLDATGDQSIIIDDQLRVVSDIGTITAVCGLNQDPWVEPTDPVDITSILVEGNNSIEIFADDIYGKNISTSELALIKIGKDPRVEIEQFMDLQCSDVSLTPLINGGSVLHVVGGEIITISDGRYTWNGAIESIKFKEDSKSFKAIEFDINLLVERNSVIPPTIYTPPFCNIANIDYEEFTDIIQGSSTTTKITDENKEYYNKYSIKKYPQSVSEDEGSGCERYTNWVNDTAIKTPDGKYAYAYLNSSGVGCTHNIYAGNFGIKIPAKAEVTRVKVQVKYANNSRIRSPYFNKAKHHLVITGPGLYQDVLRNFTQGRTPDKPIVATFDSNNGDFNISKRPSVYNDPSFKVRYSTTLDKYKTCWIDYIVLFIEYRIKKTEDTQNTEVITTLEPLIEESDNESCYALGTMRITEPQEVKKVRVSGSACNGPAWLEINGVRKNWHYCHDGTTGNNLPKGSEILEFLLDSPSTELNFSTSKHRKYGNAYSDNLGCILDWIEVFYA